MSFSSPRRFSSKPLSSASDPSWLNTAYRFLMLFPSSLEAGSTIARYGPSTSNRMLHSVRVSYRPDPSAASAWYWVLLNDAATSALNTDAMYESVAFLPPRVTSVNVSGKEAGNAHQMPSVSSSSDTPSRSTRSRARRIIAAPVCVTTPAISIEYHRAPRRMT